MNSDLSKIYSENVNKQKVYLNSNIHQPFQIIEEAKNGPIGTLIGSYLSALFPDKYSALTDSGGAKGNILNKKTEVGIDDLKADLLAAAKTEDKILTDLDSLCK